MDERLFFPYVLLFRRRMGILVGGVMTERWMVVPSFLYNSLMTDAPSF